MASELKPLVTDLIPAGTPATIMKFYFDKKVYRNIKGKIFKTYQNSAIVEVEEQENLSHQEWLQMNGRVCVSYKDLFFNGENDDENNNLY